jgi:hypothetical protein
VNLTKLMESEGTDPFSGDGDPKGGSGSLSKSPKYIVTKGCGRLKEVGVDPL